MKSSADAGAGRRRRIVVAVDESKESMHALSWCLANVVSGSEDTLVLLHARRPRPVYASMEISGYMLTSEVMASMERHANAVSAEAVDKAKHICAAFPHVKVETLVESGDPRDVICDATDKMGAHLLVMGSHGYGLIQRCHPLIALLHVRNCLNDTTTDGVLDKDQGQL